MISIFKILPYLFPVTEVVIGLQQATYSVAENDSFAFVCTSVVSGSTAGRTITIDYQTADGNAQGKIGNLVIKIFTIISTLCSFSSK